MVLETLTATAEWLWASFEAVDIDYLSWVLWVVYPIIISFLLPLVILILVYASALFLHCYRYRHRLREAYHHDFWDGARNMLAVLWDGQGYIWHGYETRGLEHIPQNGPALIIYYHGVIPIDMYYVLAKCILEKGRLVHAVGDRFLFRIPGWRLLMEVINVIPGTVHGCVELLNQNNLLAIAPGGVREALFGDENYTLMWGKRIGFSKVALQANVPVIPMFTENCREAFRTPSWGRAWLRKIYETTRLPIVPIYGLFPVKLITHFGEPIYPEPGISPEEFKEQVESRIEDLIRQHQRRPGSIAKAILQRFPFKRKTR